jgi:hypothetical protein
MLHVSQSMEATMQLAEFFEYLRARATTTELATALDELLVLRRRRTAA